LQLVGLRRKGLGRTRLGNTKRIIPHSDMTAAKAQNPQFKNQETRGKISLKSKK
jgi:hypothetical protein